MNKLLKRVLSVVTAIAMAVTVSAVVPGADVKAAEDLSGKLVILHTNDMHGHYETNKKDGVLGISAVRALKGFYQKQGANVLLFDAGDFSQGTNLVNYYDGLNAVTFMNAAGYDAVSLGNHEFDFGFEELKAMANAADFSILDANVLNKATNEPLFGSNKIYSFGKTKVGVFGLDTPEAQTKASPKNVKDVTILANEELYSCAQAQIDALKAQGCNYIVCIGHLGVDDESMGNRSIDVVSHVTGLDLFIDGHSHTELEGGKDVNGTKIVSTGSYLNNVGVVVYDGEKTTAKFIDDIYYYGGCPSMDEFVASYAKVVNEAYEGTFATTLQQLNGKKAPGVRTQETNLGDFAADAYRYAGQNYAEEYGLGFTVDGAIQNGGGIRATIDAGEISMNTLYTVFPYGNSLTIVEVTGAELLEALEASCSSCPEALGGFPQVSGIKFTIDTTVAYAKGEQYPKSTYYAPAAPGSRVTIESVGDKAFDLNATYHIAVNNFMAEGGDTYYVFTNAKEVIDTGIVDAEVLISYVNSLGGVIGEQYAAPQGNITIK